jgi:hypothetical protein
MQCWDFFSQTQETLVVSPSSATNYIKQGTNFFGYEFAAWGLSSGASL